MPLTLRWICMTVCLFVLLSGCVEDNRHIRPASEAATSGGGGAGKVTINWDQVMAESYNLFMATVSGGAESGQKISNVGKPFQITDLKIGQTYYFAVSTVNDEKTSLQSGEIAHTIQSPDDSIKIPFTARTTEITLAWDDTEEATAYNIYWRSAPGVTRQNGIKIPTVKNPYKLTGLIPGVPYYFVVTAVGKSGAESNVSEEISYQSDR